MNLYIRVNTLRRTWVCRNIDHVCDSKHQYAVQFQRIVPTSISRRIAYKAISEYLNSLEREAN
jgi:hypothetical protein